MLPSTVFPPRVVRILASVRVPSGHGQDVDYEIVHALVRPGNDPNATRESILLRLASGETPLTDRPVEILAQDLPAVHAEWNRFVSSVLARRADSGDPAARAALQKLEKADEPEEQIVISASGGRFGPKGKAPDAPIFSAGPRKAAAPPPPQPAPEPAPSKPSFPEDIQVVAFPISSPPGADDLVRLAAAQPKQLVIVAPEPVAHRVRKFVEDMKRGVQGPPTTFTPVVLRRTLQGRPVVHKALRGQIAAGLARILGDMNSALWILPE
jgi:hypothetical protein